MFHFAAKLLTLLSVLAHAGFGCCAHHDHCLVPDSTTTPLAVESQETHSCQCGHHARRNDDAISNHADKGSDQTPCPCGEDHEGCTDHCSWLTNSKVELPTNDGMQLPAAIADVWSVCTRNAASIASISADSPPLLSDSTDTLRAKSQVWRL